jgi:hypothetical protein
MPDVLDGMQGRCPFCRRYSIVQGAFVSEEEEGYDQDRVRAIAAESDVDASQGGDQVQFPMHDFK